MTSDRAACALLSVSDKTNIVDIAKALSQAGYTLLSTGGTARTLHEAGLSVTDVARHTGAAEMMGGRVKTLHPTVHGGILGRRGVDDELMLSRNITPIDFVIVNLYPFAQTIAKPEVTFDDAIENIDIGGPAMLRSAAKNHASVAVVTDPSDYQRVIDSLVQSDSAQKAMRLDLAAKAFAHTAHYDGMIANYFGKLDSENLDALSGTSNTVVADVQADGEQADGERLATAIFPKTLSTQFVLSETLRYGENPHQRAALYIDHHPAEGSLAASDLVQGKPMSYNNMMDADAALNCVRQFKETACVIVKHANPCGVCVAGNQLDAYQGAFRTDETSAFGGIIAFNTVLDAATAAAITEQQFVEVIIAPGLDPTAKPVLEKFPNVRVLDCGNISASPISSKNPAALHLPSSQVGFQFKPISGGMLVQDEDTHKLQESDLSIVSARQPTSTELADLVFAWNVAMFVKSNAIVYCKNSCTVGVGAGQMSRVYSARIAAIKAADAGLKVEGAVMASDAFFPFRDGIDSAAEVGITAVIQPGGSMRDKEVINAANEHGMAMVFTGVRHFRH